MLVSGGALHAPPVLLRGAPPQFDFFFFLGLIVRITHMDI